MCFSRVAFIHNIDHHWLFAYAKHAEYINIFLSPFHNADLHIISSLLNGRILSFFFDSLLRVHPIIQRSYIFQSYHYSTMMFP